MCADESSRHICFHSNRQKCEFIEATKMSRLLLAQFNLLHRHVFRLQAIIARRLESRDSLIVNWDIKSVTIRYNEASHASCDSSRFPAADTAPPTHSDECIRKYLPNPSASSSLQIQFLAWAALSLRFIARWLMSVAAQLSSHFHRQFHNHSASSFCCLFSLNRRRKNIRAQSQLNLFCSRKNVIFSLLSAFSIICSSMERRISPEFRAKIGEHGV